jgi:two-component system, response regulator PdtaR
MGSFLSAIGHHRVAAQAPKEGNGLPVAASTEVDAGLGRLRILVAEDDFLIAMQIVDALSGAGLDVVGIAATAEEAVAMAHQAHPALVLMDVRLAGKRDGIDAARELFDELGIRCIFATANDDRHNRERAQPYAPLGWLTKPYTMASLLDAIAGAALELG